MAHRIKRNAARQSPQRRDRRHASENAGGCGPEKAQRTGGNAQRNGNIDPGYQRGQQSLPVHRIPAPGFGQRRRQHCCQGVQHRGLVHAVELLAVDLEGIDESRRSRRETQAWMAEHPGKITRAPPLRHGQHGVGMDSIAPRRADRQAIMQKQPRRLPCGTGQVIPAQRQGMINQTFGRVGSWTQCGSSPPDTFMLSPVM